MNSFIPTFIPLSEGGGERVLDEVRELGLDCELAGEVTDSFLDMADGAAIALLPDCLLVRIYDGEKYVFLSPIGLIDPWDMKRAVVAVRDYAVREMIPLYFTDVMREELDVYTELFRFVDARAYDDDCDLFFLTVTNECDALDSIPKLVHGRVRLGEISEADARRYSELCESCEVNRFWGYDVSADNPECDMEYHLSVARREFASGCAVTLGVYLDSELIGEGVIYAFDMAGGASVALRLLPEHQGHGLGTETLGALIRIARDMGLLYLTAEVMLENFPSIAMTKKQMKCVSADGERVYFRLEL
ncbi:MAG: GNAT family N-acetyltransferase [Clostridia bacterium]|nr:GNAT family N-acetyltransferase [Clostridia bacterium]